MTGGAEPGPRPSQPGVWLRALRVHQWVKNILVFVPALAAHRFDAETLATGAVAFLSFCLVASAGYLLNDYLDLENDRADPAKCGRPLASGALRPWHAMAVAPLLLAVGLAVAGAISLPLAGLVAGYAAGSALYSWALKRIAVVDVLALDGLYLLRVLGGGTAVGLTVSAWLLAFCGFLFLSVAIIKRVSELAAGGADLPAAGRRGYRAGDLAILEALAAASGFISVLVFALYINSPMAATLYVRPEGLWLVCPLLGYWICRALLLTHRGEMNHDPVVFAVTDRASLLTVVLVLAVIFASAQ